MEVIVDSKRGVNKPLRLISICQAVCEHFQIPERELRGSKRHQALVYARHVFCYIAFEYTSASKCKIGHFLNRDHTTIIHALRRILRDHEGDLEFSQMCINIAKEAYEIDEAKRQELKREAEELNQILGINEPRDYTEFAKYTEIERHSGQPEQYRTDDSGNAVQVGGDIEQKAQRLSGRVCEIRKTDKGYWVYPQ
jgi:hypothetical protein